MTLEELQQQVNDDLPVRPDNLEGAALDNMKLYSKYLTMLSGLKLEMKRALSHLNEVKTSQFKYYSGKDHENVFEFVLSATEIKQFMAGDAAIIKAEMKLELVRAKVELLEESIKAIRDRGFTIKNVIDLRKLEAGY